jgi:molecular chaperone DnaK (HSP70)
MLCIYLLLAGNAHAAIYKWVDENGNVQYTETPPPAEVKAETIQPPPSPMDSETAIKQLSEQERQLDESRKKRQEQAVQEARAADEIALQKKNCQMAKDRLASYASPRVKITQEDGSKVRATEEQRQEQIKKSEDMIKEFCKE